MKLIILLLLTFQITYESKLKQAGVMKGDHLDGRYNMIDIYHPESTKPMSILWQGQDMENDNDLVIMKKKLFLQRIQQIQVLLKIYRFEHNGVNGQRFPIRQNYLMQDQDRKSQLIRRAISYFRVSEQECNQLKIISYRIPQNQNSVTFDKCITPQLQEPTKIEYPEEDIYQQKLSAYKQTPFYNVFEKPQGKNLLEICIDKSCRFLIRDISKNILRGLTYLQSSTVCYKHGNLNLNDIFYSSESSKFTISNFQYNKYVGTKSTVPWQTDMADLGLLLIKILSRSESFLLQQYILTPLDLFNEINKSFKFPLIKGDFPRVPEQPSATYSRVISFLQTRQNISRNQNQNNTQKPSANIKKQEDTGELIVDSDPNEFKSSVDVDMGVPQNFNPNDMRLSLLQKNEDLSESIYDFIFQLMGNTFVKETQIKQFANLEQALNHPFIQKDIGSNPSDY